MKYQNVKNKQPSLLSRFIGRNNPMESNTSGFYLSEGGMTYDLQLTTMKTKIKTTAAILLTFNFMNFTNFITFNCHAQTDTEFWFAAPEVVSQHADTPIYLRITSFGQASVVTVSQPANSLFVPIVVNVQANETKTIDLSSRKDIIENKPADKILNYGLLIQSTNPITAYYEVAGIELNSSGVNNAVNSDIFTLKGKNALGTDFWIPMQKQHGNSYTSQGNSGTSFDIVATEDNTTVTIIPKVDIVGHPKGVPFTIILNKGQTYSAVAKDVAVHLRLTGSRVTSDKPIAITIKDDSMVMHYSKDLVGDQIVPTNILGKEYIVVTGPNRCNNTRDEIFIFGTEDSTNIYINGKSMADRIKKANKQYLYWGDSTYRGSTINAGGFYLYNTSNYYPTKGHSTYIKADKPVYILHLTGFNCEIGGAVVPPMRCTGSQQIAFTRTTNETFALLLFTQNGSQDDFILNGSSTAIKASEFDTVPGTSGAWVAANVSLDVSVVPVGTANIVSNTSSRFHAGIINAGGGGATARYGYFSNYGSTVEKNTTAMLCLEDSVVMDAGIGKDSVRWSTGDTTQFITITNIKDTGYYWVTTYEGTCVATDSIYVNFGEVKASVSNDTSICIGDTVTLIASGGISYVWNTGHTDDTLIVNPSGTTSYSITVSNSQGCTDRDTVSVNVYSFFNATIEPVETLCANDVPVSLQAASYGGVWSGTGITDSITGTFDPSAVNTGTYIITYRMDGSCGDTDEVEITVKTCESVIWVPNVFTPNNDGVNDKFPKGDGINDDFYAVGENITCYHLSIFNRWGELLFETEEFSKNWDGTYKGSLVPDGVYIWLINYCGYENNNIVEKDLIGHVTVLK